MLDDAYRIWLYVHNTLTCLVLMDTVHTVHGHIIMVAAYCLPFFMNSHAVASMPSGTNADASMPMR